MAEARTATSPERLLSIIELQNAIIAAGLNSDEVMSLVGERAGTLTGIASPLHTGRTTQVWEVEVRGDDGRLVAKGRVRMQCLERGARVAGETVAIKPPPRDD